MLFTSSRDQLKLIIELYKNDVWSFVDVLELYQRSTSRDDKGPSLQITGGQITYYWVSCKTKNQCYSKESAKRCLRKKISQSYGSLGSPILPHMGSYLKTKYTAVHYFPTKKKIPCVWRVVKRFYLAAWPLAVVEVRLCYYLQIIKGDTVVSEETVVLRRWGVLKAVSNWMMMRITFRWPIHIINPVGKPKLYYLHKCNMWLRIHKSLLWGLLESLADVRNISATFGSPRKPAVIILRGP